jgi:pyruvate,water dikinase
MPAVQPPDRRLVIPLTQLGRNDLQQAGGKGANLGELLRAGFPVPPGFVVTTAAYDRFVEHNHLADVLAGALADEQHCGATIRAAVEQAAIPPEVAAAVVTAYQTLGAGPVAVRSSATAEDLPEAAFAGQQDTFLNVMGEPAVLDAVRACWASLWSDRAIAYRKRQGIDQADLKFAVVVQRMVPAAVAGVMFTANPVTGARDEIVIDASPGLGEAIVSGLVTPDHYVLHKRWWRWNIIERQLGRREVTVQARASGGTEQISSSQAATPAQALPDRVLRQLARLGRAVERHFGAPQDIEWAWVNGKPFLLQSRPMTALPAPLRADRILKRMARLMGEMVPIRPYPFDVTTYTAVLLRSMGTVLGGQLGLAPWEPERIFREEEGVVVGFGGSHFRPTLRILVAPLLLLWRAIRFDPTHWRQDPRLLTVQARVRELEDRDLRILSWEEILVSLREALGLVPQLAELRLQYYPRAALATGALWLWLMALGQRQRFGTLLTGVETKTVEANQALETLATELRANPTLAQLFLTEEASQLPDQLATTPAGRGFLAQLDAFLDRYGHRETAITVASQPTWKDAPEIVLGLLQGLVRTSPPKRASRPAWMVARDQVLAQTLFRLPLARHLFLGILQTARQFIELREDTHFYLTLPMPIIRCCALELGRRLQRIGVLETPEDVFHLKLSELEAIRQPWPPAEAVIRQLRELVRRRIAKRESLRTVPMIDPRLLPPTETVEQALLSGTSGSPGVAEGPVRIIGSATEFGKLQPGDVLVAPYTNPTWTPLFQRAAAVVVDSGGAASHAAIVAREYGIPAVMGTVDGTHRLQEGQQVVVDGDRGLVLLVESTIPSARSD